MTRKILQVLSLLAMINMVWFGLDCVGIAKVLNNGDKSPLFALESTQGQTVDLAQHIGSEVMVLGLFHICEPCRNQAMELQKLLEAEKGQKVLVVGINVSGDSRAAVTDYLNSFPRKVSFPYLLDPSRSVEELFSVKSTPIVYILDRQGIIRFRGSSVPAQVLQKEVAKLLATGTPKD